jgi:hypothetical protein
LTYFSRLQRSKFKNVTMSTFHHTRIFKTYMSYLSLEGFKFQPDQMSILPKRGQYTKKCYTSVPLWCLVSMYMYMYLYVVYMYVHTKFRSARHFQYGCRGCDQTNPLRLGVLCLVSKYI